MVQPPFALFLFNWHWFWKRPAAIDNFLARLIESDKIVPALHDRQEVGLFGVTAEMDGHAAVLVLGAGDIVHRVGVVLVLLRIPFIVIQADRPETVHRHVFHIEGVSGLPSFISGVTPAYMASF